MVTSSHLVPKNFNIQIGDDLQLVDQLEILPGKVIEILVLH
jgi:hypothetical protein